MAEFHMMSLGKEDLALVNKVLRNVPGVKTREGAVKWVLKQYAAEHPDFGIGLKLAGPAVFDPGEFNDTHLPLGKHHEFGIAHLVREKDALRHIVVVAPDTFRRLVPDKARRTKLIGRVKSRPGLGA
jgi:hypothetical protein